MPTKNPLYSVIRRDDPAPAALTRRNVLFGLYYLQQWECIAQPVSGPYAAGYFYNNIRAILHGLDTGSRRVAMNILTRGTCVACDGAIPPRSEFDHLIPRSQGGPNSLDNAAPLCPRCNSSKGTKDLLEWWIWKGYDALTLPREVLCMYARVYWQHGGPAVVDVEAPEYLVRYLVLRASALPTDDHRIALFGAIAAGLLYCALAQGAGRP